MSFFPPTPRGRLVPGAGSKSAKIAIVGDYTSAFDDKALVPFSGPSGSVLESCLHAAGLIKGEVYLTNIFKRKTSLAGKMANMDFFNEAKKQFTDEGLEYAKLLVEELETVDANIIVASGNPALIALTGKNSVAKYRGYVLGSTCFNKIRKIIPTYSFGGSIRSGFTQRHIIVHDLKKVKQESHNPAILRPERQRIFVTNLEEVFQWIQYFKTLPELAFDIEVINYEISCISFGDPSGKLGVVIPIGDSTIRQNEWTELEELQIWRAVQEILGDEKIDKVGQNAIFDIHFLLTRCGVVVRGKIKDTMIGHSVMFPDLPKGLDFLGSLYCGAQEYWKDAVKFNNIKGES